MLFIIIKKNIVYYYKRMFNNIIDPRNNKSYSIFSNEGKQLLKLLVNQSNNSYNQMGGVKQLDDICPISQEELRNEKDSEDEPLQVVKTNEGQPNDGHYYHEKGLIQWLNSSNGNGKDPLTKKKIKWVKRVNMNDVLEKDENGEFLNKTIDDENLGEEVWGPDTPQTTQPPSPPEYELVALATYGSTPWIVPEINPWDDGIGTLAEPWAIDFSDLSVYNKENEEEKYIYQDINNHYLSAFKYICYDLLGIGSELFNFIEIRFENADNTVEGEKRELKYWLSMWKGVMEHTTKNPPDGTNPRSAMRHPNHGIPITIKNWKVHGLIRFLNEVFYWNDTISNLILTNEVNYNNCYDIYDE